MTENTIQCLEWEKLLSHYSALCFSAPAKALALSTIPEPSLAEAQERLDETEEALVVNGYKTFSFLGGIEEMSAPLARLGKQMTLDGKELLHVAKLLEIASELRSEWQEKSLQAGCPRLTKIAHAISFHGKESAPIRSAIDEQGEVRDSASPELRSLRAQARKLHLEAKEIVDTIVADAHRDGYLQERFFDVRDGRYLVPVKSEFKNKVPGQPVESSATKATIYVEPAALRAANDRLKELQLLIEEEIYRILSDLSRSLFPLAEELKNAYGLCVLIDLILARGSFAKELAEKRGAVKPLFSDCIELHGFYHPLLSYVMKPEQVVRNDFSLGPDKKSLVISGPNTGGKTVILKSVGLAALMAKCGFYLPCSHHAEIPFFSSVVAQIGDSQNLEQSLSSFSGSVLHLKAVLEQCGPGSLILIDEILHSTDPEEASALARALLDIFQEHGAFALVTTHLSGLKVTEGSSFESASMEFDSNNLLPTYRLRMGVPGSSRALDIASRLGLSANVVNRAKSYLSGQKIREQGALDSLEAKERELEVKKKEVEELSLALAEEKEKFSRLNADLAASKKQFRAEALEKIQAAQAEAQQTLQHTIDEYKKKISDLQAKHLAGQEAQQSAETVRRSYVRVQETIAEALPKSNETEPDEEPSAPFAQNGEVLVTTMKSQGTLLSDPADRSKPAEVLVGNMRVRVPWDKLLPKRGTSAPMATKKIPTVAAVSSRSEFDCPEEINLIGKTVDEAEVHVSLFIDKAARSGRSAVRIVHGHGSGALKNAIRQYLRSCPYDMKFRPGMSNEGGDGCTVVEFV